MTREAISDAYQLTAIEPAVAELGPLVRAADALHGPVAFHGMPVRAALQAEAPPETAGLQLILHGVRLTSAHDAAALQAAGVVTDAAYAAITARQGPRETAR